MKKLCPKCKVELELVPACPTGWSDEHLACPKCDGTFNLGDGTYMLMPDDEWEWLKKVRAQWKASAEFGWKGTYDDVDYIR
jgi:uncharacterized protein YbaR (Trm112 family)